MQPPTLQCWPASTLHVGPVLCALPSSLQRITVSPSQLTCRGTQTRQPTSGAQTWPDAAQSVRETAPPWPSHWVASVP